MLFANVHFFKYLNDLIDSYFRLPLITGQQDINWTTKTLAN